ncbi:MULTISPECIES: threonine ammonia-lyase IlvA [Priestia]|jgi:threonine dehydratase|nr:MULTISPECIES: threonine ammonia-lyase IlvA [Priestia]AVX09955.1 threonine dehydratase [Bacillus sp. Y-01]KOP76054.1 threonine dehydratase [Bacillus sp. FJAT-21351]KQU22884.1 threonine dehydratase [Bacillus sp. Leaf75]KRD89833.1 threonine dehydratase [Bacillus sp. Root147]KRE05326.1 threonine dehydratase [Bacillus sp. Root239]KRF57353.1 threonine dehydratase [Bacillus sp. Soil531]MBK0008367.1 threonine ammonia-lyase IlvA [Bacillus sp. S35]MBK0293817.1 threonine ammonia-lyase IlvA [Bacillu
MKQQVDNRTKHVHLEDIMIANQLIKDVVVHTPLQRNDVLSERYECNIYLKREDLQVVRSFKIRGAYNRIKKLSPEELENGIACASAGNHAQGVAYACRHLNIDGKIFMPSTTPRQKINQVKFLGKDNVKVVLIGDTFDDSYEQAIACSEEEHRTFIHPFNDVDVIAGQGTVAVEMFNDCEDEIDYVFAGIGGGGLISGVGTYVKSISPQTAVIGVEPAGAPGMQTSLANGNVVTLPAIDPFVDGAAVKTVGTLPYDISKELVDDIVVVPEGKVCTTILSLYNENAIVAEPAGALSIAALDSYREQIKGKTVVCVISGGNNDIGRMQEIKERSMIYEGLQHYFIVNFPQRAGALREFLDEVLGPTDDISRFEYTKKNNKDSGPALVGIELKHKEDYYPLINRMDKKGFPYTEINKESNLFHLFI